MRSNLNLMDLKTIILFSYGEPTHVGFGEVKYGRKYVYVKFWMDEGRKLKPSEYGDYIRYEADDVVILDGVRRRLKRRFLKWRKAVYEWEDSKRQFQYDLEYKLRSQMREQMEKWEKENPRPKFRFHKRLHKRQ